VFDPRSRASRFLTRDVLQARVTIGKCVDLLESLCTCSNAECVRRLSVIARALAGTRARCTSCRRKWRRRLLARVVAPLQPCSMLDAAPPPPPSLPPHPCQGKEIKFLRKHSDPKAEPIFILHVSIVTLCRSYPTAKARSTCFCTVWETC
jgi:hypothetical protein